MIAAVVPAGGLARVGGGFATYSSYGDFLNELGALVGRIVIYAPIIERCYPEYEYHADRPLDSQYCDVVPLPAHPRGDPGLSIVKNYAVQFGIFLKHVRTWDRALIYSPSVTASLAILAWRITRARPTPAVAYIWGDWAQLAAVLPQRGLLRRTLDPIQRRFLLAQEGWLVRRADATLVAGSALLRRYGNRGRHVLETVPMIKMDQLATERRSAGRVSNRLLFVGRVVPGKGIEVLFKALSHLRLKIPSVTVRIVGGGDQGYLTKLRELADSLGIRGVVEFAGVIPNGPDLWREYEQASLFVCPSLSEGFPRVLYEAMALAIPMVSTNVGGIPDLLTDQVHALLVPPSDAQNFARACHDILTNPDLASRLVEASRSLFMKVQAKSSGMSTAKLVAQLLSAAVVPPKPSSETA